jgi:hypothetical protein
MHTGKSVVLSVMLPLLFAAVGRAAESATLDLLLKTDRIDCRLPGVRLAIPPVRGIRGREPVSAAAYVTARAAPPAAKPVSRQHAAWVIKIRRAAVLPAR